MKSATKKATTKATEKKAAPKKGLRPPQLRILAALDKAKEPLTRAEIAEEAEVDRAWLTEHIGAADAAKRKANDAAKWPSLLTLGMVKEAGEADAVATYAITAKGRKAAAKAE